MNNKKDSKKKDSNVYMGIAGFATGLYSLYNYIDTKQNPSENIELNKANEGIAIFGMIVSAIEVIVAFKAEEKERKEAEKAMEALEALEEARKALEETNKKV